VNPIVSRTPRSPLLAINGDKLITNGKDNAMGQTAPNPPVDTRKYRTSWRLTFRFDGERISLLRRERLQKVAPGTSPEAPVPGKNSGAWVEILDRSGRRLFHRLLIDPLRTRAEHHSPEGRIELHLRAPEPCEFTAVVPDIPDASEVVLYASPAEPKRMLEPAREVGRYALSKRRQEGEMSDPQD
jgi:hypothetical protein